MTKKQITIDDLAIMVKKGFDGTDKKMDSGFKQVDKRFEQIDKRFKQVDKRFEQVDKQLKEINVRLDRIENVILKQHAQRIEFLEEKIHRLEEFLIIK
ncbi:hypothetical protein KKA09_02660 [Patescibacteria group bacterium]|nr:hypothetical protein [Patescibacteria group bacterium]